MARITSGNSQKNNNNMRIAAAALLALFPFASAASDNVYSYPAKSVNPNKASPAFYTAYGDIIEDAHPVAGIPTSNGNGHGGYVLCGKGMEAEDRSENDAFAVRLDTEGKLIWKWKSGQQRRDDVANAVVQLPNGGDLLVVGFRTVNSVAKRAITKLDFATGKEKWTMTFDDSRGSHGAFEMATVSANAKYVYVSGLHKKPSNQEMHFKSYGNAAGGKAIAHKLKVSALLSDSKPSMAAAVEWTQTFPQFETAKDIEELPVSKNVAIMFWSETRAVSFTALRASDGTALWTKEYPEAKAEPTDFTTHEDTSGNRDYIAMTGNAKVTPSGEQRGISGRIVKIDATSGGKFLWAKSYSAGGTPELIFNECWGIASLNDGYVLGCGTGIEGCNGFASGSKLRRDCNSGKGDKRPGAYQRKAGVWQSMVVRTDFEGELQWKRVDSFKGDGAKSMGASGWLRDATSSASEWIMVDKEGMHATGKQRIVAVNDEVFGAGLLALDESSNAIPPTVTNQPTSRPPATPRPTQRITSAPKSSEIVLIGDSWAEFAGTQTVKKACGSSFKVTNGGIGGTTAAQWSASSSLVSESVPGTQDVITVVLSLGGNDYLNRQCSLSKSQISNLDAALKSVVSKVKNRAPNARIVSFGYPRPSSEAECPGVSSPGELVTTINNLLADAFNNLEGVDVMMTPSDFFGSGPGNAGYSNKKYFVDAIHLSSVGYDKLFDQPAAKRLLGCSDDGNEETPTAPPTNPPAPTMPPTNEVTTKPPKPSQPPTEVPTDEEEDEYDEDSDAGDQEEYDDEDEEYYYDEYYYDELSKTMGKRPPQQVQPNGNGGTAVSNTTMIAGAAAGVGVFALLVFVIHKSRKRTHESSGTAEKASKEETPIAIVV